MFPFELTVEDRRISFQFAPKESSFYMRGKPSLRAKEALSRSELKINFAHVIDMQGGRKYRKSLSILVADFDKLPEGYDTFGELVEELKRWYLGAVVMHSKSGRCKAFFLVDMSGVKLSRENRLKVLLGILPEHLHKYVDVMGTDESFFNERMMNDWIDQKDSMSVINGSEVIQQTHNTEWHNTTVCKKTLAVPTEGVSFLTHVCKIKSEKETRVLSNIVATPGIASDKGAQLPQSAIAEAVDVDRTQVSRVIAKLLKAGILELVSAKYFPGKQAKKYRLLNKEAIEAHEKFLKDSGYTPRASLDCLPSLIDGNTYAHIPLYVRQAKNSGMSEVEAIDWIYSTSMGKMSEKECASRVRSLWDKCKVS